MANTVELNTLGSVIKQAYEDMPNTNAYTDAEKTKLAGINLPIEFEDLNGVPDFITEDRIGVPDGIAPLDSAGLVPLAHLNVSGLSFKGSWNPLTNTPNLVNGSGSVGDFYKAGASGTFNFGNGDYTFNEGDWAIFAAGVWQRIGSSDLVASVNGKLGAVVLTAADVGALPSSYTAPVTSINSKTGAAVLNADDVGALPSTYTPPAQSWSVITGKPKLSYEDRIGVRTANTWYDNSSGMDRIVNITTNYIASSDSSRLEMRSAGTTTPVFSSRAQATGTGSTNKIIQAHVPSGWEYRFVPGTSRTISTWFEGDYS